MKRVLRLLIILIAILLPFAWMLFSGPCPAKPDGTFMRCKESYTWLICISVIISIMICTWLVSVLKWSQTKVKSNVISSFQLLLALMLLAGMTGMAWNQILTNGLCMRTDMPCYRMKDLSLISFMITYAYTVIVGTLFMKGKTQESK